MNTFLHHVAQDLIAKYGYDLSPLTVVFPNKRASLFLNQELARLSGRPLWSPNYITISELFRRQSRKTVGDPIQLIFELYKVYKKVTGEEESIDKFYGWGQLLLSDFDDIDKNMADASRIFANLKDLHALDDVTYLDEEQKESLKRFFSNFSEDQDSVLKHRFLTLWSRFGDLYTQLNQSLSTQGLAYEGALYKEVATDPHLNMEDGTYLFVGFNMMQKVEQALCERLKKAGKAKFYWDFDAAYMPPGHSGREAGYFIAQYLRDFPNELDQEDGDIYRNLEKPKEITYVSATTENVQARYVSTWLRDPARIEAGRKTAIVMADEGLLPTVIHSLPPEVEKVNVTTGYPLSQSPVTALVRQLIDLQVSHYRSDLGKYRLNGALRLLRHPYIKWLSGRIPDLCTALRQSGHYYLSPEELYTYPGKDGTETDAGLALLFQTPTGTTADLAHWLVEVLNQIGIRYGRIKHPTAAAPLFQESLFRMYTLLDRLAALLDHEGLEIDRHTLLKLMTQIIDTTTIPFHGEPAEGLQIMGVLETRNLDFEHLLVLSCNEGNLPKGVNDTSFIPYSVRKAYGLTTIDHKVAIYSYYFYRLLQRAKEVTLVYNESTNDGKTGEMSRFMLQLMVESPYPIHRAHLVTGQDPGVKKPSPVPKDERVMRILDGIQKLSPTALNTYIRCQLRFYYKYIAGIKEPDEEDEDQIDNRTFGNIFHLACQLYYLEFAGPEDLKRQKDPKGKEQTELVRPIAIQKEKLEKTLHTPGFLDRIVDSAFRQEYFKSAPGSRIEYNGLQLINRQVMIDYLRRVLEMDLDLAPFAILGLEKHVESPFEIPTPHGTKTLTLYGNIDRLDQVQGTDHQVCLRVIDYKTGNNNKMSVKTIGEIFTGENLKNHTDYYLQAMLYADMVRQKEEYNPRHYPVSPMLLFIQHSLTGNPVLRLDKDPITDIADYSHKFEEKIRTLLKAIFNPDLSLTPTEDRSRCTNCPYLKICYS